MQVLTFGNLIDETLEAMGFAGETGNLRTIVANSIRRNHERRVTRLDYPFMRMPKPSTLSLVAGQRSYSLSPLFRAPIYFRLQQTGAPIVLEQSDMLLDNGLPLEATTANQVGVIRGELRGQTNVKRQPATTGVLTTSSSSVLDNGKTVLLQGEDADGDYIEQTVLLGAAGDPVTFATLFWVTKQADSFSGTVTVLDIDGNTLVSIPATSAQGVLYRQLYLLDKPASADTVEYDFWRLPNALTSDYDIPNIPPPFSRILIYDALLDSTGYWRPSAEERNRIENLMIEQQHDLDSTYQDGQGNLASGSYTKLVPR